MPASQRSLHFLLLLNFEIHISPKGSAKKKDRLNYFSQTGLFIPYPGSTTRECPRNRIGQENEQWPTALIQRGMSLSAHLSRTQRSPDRGARASSTLVFLTGLPGAISLRMVVFAKCLTDCSCVRHVVLRKAE
jgi:hypothetical protein